MTSKVCGASASTIAEQSVALNERLLESLQSDLQIWSR